MAVVFDLFRVTCRQSRKSAHLHPHVQRLVYRHYLGEKDDAPKNVTTYGFAQNVDEQIVNFERGEPLRLGNPTVKPRNTSS